MRGLLIRIGIDQTAGRWNAPCRGDGSFCYIPMQPPNAETFEHGFETAYDEFEQDYRVFVAGNGPAFPDRLHKANCHLDPDFRFLSYGDRGQRGARIRTFFEGSQNNFIVFYASFQPIDYSQQCLVYAIIGLYCFQDVGLAKQIPPDQRNQNAHSRLVGYERNMNTDVAIFADQKVSGRLKLLIPIGERRPNGQYYVKKSLFNAWGGISSNDGWIQRGVYPPDFCDPESFLKWFNEQSPEFVHKNNVPY